MGEGTGGFGVAGLCTAPVAAAAGLGGAGVVEGAGAGFFDAGTEKDWVRMVEGFPGCGTGTAPVADLAPELPAEPVDPVAAGFGVTRTTGAGCCCPWGPVEGFADVCAHAVAVAKAAARESRAGCRI